MEFIQKYARVNRSDEDDDRMSTDGEDGVVRDEFVDDSFIDDSAENDQDQDLATYRLTNVTRGLQEAVMDQSMYKYPGYCYDPENFAPDSFDNIEYDLDDFMEFEKRSKKFFTLLCFSVQFLLCSKKK